MDKNAKKLNTGEHDWILNPPSEPVPCPECGHNMGYRADLTLCKHVPNTQCSKCLKAIKTSSKSSLSWLKERPSEPVTCPVCGLNMGYRPDFKLQKTVPNTECSHCIKQSEEAAAMAARMAEVERLKHNIKQVLIDRGAPLKYRSLELDQPSGKLAELMAEIEAGRSSYVHGGTGVGKSSYIVTVMERLILSGKYHPSEVRYWEAPSLCAYVRDGIDTGKYEVNLKECATMPLLIIDDMGTEMVTANNKAIMLQIIAQRYENHLQTLITSNLDGKAFQSRYDARAASRVAAMAVFKFEGVDRRKTEKW